MTCGNDADGTSDHGINWQAMKKHRGALKGENGSQTLGHSKLHILNLDFGYCRPNIRDYFLLFLVA